MNDYEFIDLNPKNLKIIWEWRNSEHIRLNMMNNKIIAWEEHLAWYERTQKSSNSIYKVFVMDQCPTGLINFTAMDSQSHTCNWGFYVGREGVPKGTGTKMCYLGLKYAFDELCIRKVCAEVIASNQSSQRIHDKLGFQKEGVLKRQLLRNGDYIDVILFALFREQWTLKQDELKEKISF